MKPKTWRHIMAKGVHSAITDQSRVRLRAVQLYAPETSLMIYDRQAAVLPPLQTLAHGWAATASATVGRFSLVSSGLQFLQTG